MKKNQVTANNHGAIAILSIILPVVVAVLGLLAIILLLAGSLTTAAFGIGSLILLGIISGFLFKRSHLPHTVLSRFTWTDYLVIVFIACWVLTNMFFTAQHVFTNRDPGVYTVTARHLVDRQDLQLDSSKVYQGIKGIGGFSAGFSNDTLRPAGVAAQGAHLLPAFVGLAGRVLGEAHMLRLNTVFGGIAILSLYVFGRFVVSKKWAALAAITYATVFPLMYFSRDLYTEPLLTLFTFGGLSLMIVAMRSGKNLYWFLSGLVIGAGAMTRIDGYLVIAGVMAASLVWLLVSLQTGTSSLRRLAFTQACLLAGLLISGGVGFLDIYYLSNSYFLSEWPNLRLELLFIGLLLVFGYPLAIMVGKSQKLRLVYLKHRNILPNAIGVMIATVSLVLMSRPLWYRATKEKLLYESDGTVRTLYERNFAELTVNWLSWYLGALTVLLGVVGLYLIVKRVIDKKQIELLPFIFVFSGTALVYLVDPSIFPDQIWASRRFLPIVMPGLIILAVLSTEAIMRLRNKKLNYQFVAGALAALILIGPIFVTRDLFTAREATWLSPLKTTCNSLEPDSAVVWLGRARTELIEPTKAFCGVDAEGYGPLFNRSTAISKETLVSIYNRATEQGKSPIVGLFGSDVSLLPDSLTNVSPLVGFSYQQIEATHTTPPKKIISQSESIIVGTILPDGQIEWKVVE